MPSPVRGGRHLWCASVTRISRETINCALAMRGRCAMKSILQALFQRAGQKATHEARIEKPDFGLRRMNIDIDLARVTFEKEGKRRVAALRHIIQIGRAYCPCQKLVANRPSVYEKKLRSCIGFVPCREAGKALETKALAPSVNAKRIGAKLFAEHIRDPREQCLQTLTARPKIVARG